MKFLPFIWRQLTRNKLRTALTAGAIGLAVALVCLLLTMPAGMDALLDDVASNSRIVVHNEAGLVYPLPYSYLQKIRAKEGVVGAASWTWFGGAFREDSRSSRIRSGSSGRTGGSTRSNSRSSAAIATRRWSVA
ncbi:MAG: hypothetical protein MUF70_10855 [Myxococcota bacterium]|nr:hypothetical protein [Myxococcota bacterium]